jgi:hypothetical protein
MSSQPTPPASRVQEVIAEFRKALVACPVVTPRDTPTKPAMYREDVSKAFDAFKADLLAHLASQEQRIRELEQQVTRAHAACDAADRLMAGCLTATMAVEDWRKWRREHRQALCDEALADSQRSPVSADPSVGDPAVRGQEKA